MALGEVIQEFGVAISLNFDEKAASKAQDKIKKLGDELKSFGLGIAGMAASVFEMGNLFSSNARSLQNQADMLGINTDELQEYEYAAKVAADVNREDLVSSLHSVGMMMDRARAGDQDAINTLLKLSESGVGTAKMLENLHNRSYKATDAMRDLSAGIQNVYRSSPQAAARLAEAAFGNDKLMPLLKDGPAALDKLTAEAKKNWVMSQAQIRQGKEMDIQFTKIWLTFKKLGYEIGEKVLKHIKPMVEQFRKWFAANKELIGSGINDFLDIFADVLKSTFEIITETAKALGPLIEALGGTKEAIKLLVEGFLLFKGAQFASTLAGIIAGFNALTIAGTPFLGWVAAVGAVVAAFHDLYEMLFNGKSFKETWIGQGVDYVEKLLMSIGLLKESLHIYTAIGDKLSDWWEGNNKEKTSFSAQGAGRIGNPSSGALAKFGAPIAQPNGPSPNGDVNQSNSFTITNHISIPPHTPAHVASEMITKSNTDSHEKMLYKAKQDAARKRNY